MAKIFWFRRRMDMEDLYEKIRDAVTAGEDEAAARMVREALSAGFPPQDILQKGAVAGITKAGELWKANTYFLPDVILAADAFKTAMASLEPFIKGKGTEVRGKKFVIGVVAGDMHDLGKTLVTTMLQASGFEVIDLGIDVPREKFLEAVKTHKPDILGLGAYMTTTMLEMKELIRELRDRGLRNGVQVMVGGVPTSQEFAQEIGADAWGKDALDALEKALSITGGEPWHIRHCK